MKIRDSANKETTLTYGTDYTVNDLTITLVSAPAVGTTLIIYRQTATDKIVTWNDGSILLAANMNVENVQMLHLQEEQQDYLTANSIATKTTTGNEVVWDVNGKRLTDIAAPTDSQDAVTKHYMESVQDGFVVANNQIKSDVAAMQADVKSRQSDVTARQSDVTTRQTDVTNKQADITTRQSDVTTRHTDVANMQADVKSRQSDIVTRQTDIMNRQTDVKTIQADIATRQTDVTNMQTDVKTRQSDVSNMQVATKTSETNAAQSEADALAYKKACEALQAYFNVPTQLFAGSIIAWGSDTIPYGYLLCDGSAVSRTTYSELFAAIGTTWGAGDGSTTFNVPQFKDRFLLGKGTIATTLNTMAGEQTHMLSVDEMPNHNHSAAADTQGAHSHTLTWQGTTARDPNYDTFVTGTASGASPHTTAASLSIAGAHSHVISIGATGGGQAHNNMPPYNSVNFIIKYTAIGQSTADSLYRQNSTNYSVGDVLIGAVNLPKNLELICSTSGKTGAANITSWGAAGATQDDGSVKWTIRYKAGGNVSGTAPIVTSTDAQGNVTVTHSDSGVTAGVYNKVTVDAKGHVTAATAENTLAGVGITNAYTKTEVDVLLRATEIYDLTSWDKIKTLVKAGTAKTILPVGSQIVTNWTDKAANVTYAAPLDIVHYGNVTLQDGEIVPGMFLQWHYATPFGVQFNNFQAFYYAPTALTAGTYYVTFGNSWGTNVVSGKSYQFTLTKDVPVGGQLSGFEACPDTNPSNWKVKSWSSTSATTELETVSVTEGISGTLLGTLKFGGDGTLNCLQRTGYGYNRWGQSAIRQWLNSSKGLTSWWTPQNNFDRRPNELLTKQGFLTGFDDKFLAALTPIKVTTALNTVTDSAVGTTEDTYDKIFLPSLEQEFITPQLVGVEGESWDYWKRASGRTSYAPRSTNMAEYITYGIDNKTSPQQVRLRSASRSHAYYAWTVSTTGYVYNYGSSSDALRCAPACVIC